VSAGVGEGLGQRERSQGEGGCFNRESRFLVSLFFFSLSLSLLLDVSSTKGEIRSRQPPPKAPALPSPCTT
jgi:hypothetical protein